ncbi:hypothetical protein BSKO_13454 [Bryopsis sp. KO-2023]|nr:hypothetical protein BSKO_13454 [Bryopsis sp. KO-2023]
MSGPVLAKWAYSNGENNRARDEGCNESQIGTDREGQKRCGREARWVGIDATTASTSLTVRSPESQIADRLTSDDSGCSSAKISTNLQLMVDFPKPHPQQPSGSSNMEAQRSDFQCDSAMCVEPGDSRGPAGCGCVGGMFKGLWKRVKRKKTSCEAAGDRVGVKNPVAKSRERRASQLHVGNIPNGGSSQSSWSTGKSSSGMEVGKKLPATQRHYRKASMQQRCNMIEAYLSGEGGNHAMLTGRHRRCVSWDNAVDSMLVGMRAHGSAKSLHGNGAKGLPPKPPSTAAGKSRLGCSKGGHGGVSFNRRRCHSVDHGSTSESAAVVAALSGGGDTNMAKNRPAFLPVEIDGAKHLPRVSPILENEVKAI